MKSLLKIAAWTLSVASATLLLGITSPANANVSDCVGTRTHQAITKTAGIAPVPIIGNGWRSYRVTVTGLLYRCRGWATAHHAIYIDTRNLPYGHKLTFVVSTQRSDGVWARAHKSLDVTLTGRQRIDELLLSQRRGVGGDLTVTQVKVWFTAARPGNGAVDTGHTITTSYRPWNGPEARPGR